MVVNIIDGEIVGYMTSKEAAKFLRVQTGTIRQGIRRGKINDLDYFTLNVDGNHNIHYISRMFVLEKFKEMYPEVAEAAEKRKKILHDYFRVSVKNRKNTDVDEIESQLKRIDEQIANIYEQELPKEPTAEFADVRNIERIKRNLYERTKPLLDEKVRLIESSCPTYIVKGE